MPSAIQWTDETDNPIHLRREDGSNGGHWCSKESEGCAGCYAEAINQSDFFDFASHLPYTGEPPENLIFDDSIVERWSRVRSPKKRFVCSMTDLFGWWVPREWQFKVLDAAAAAPTQTIQLLTKHPRLMVLAFTEYLATGRQIPSNVWAGVTIENQRVAPERFRRIKELHEIGCITWVSYEPALEYVHFAPWFQYINWIVMGGMSGSVAEPCDIDWFRKVIAHRGNALEQGRNAPYLFVKQLGRHPYDASKDVLILRNRHGGNIEEFPPELQVREFPSELQVVDYRPQESSLAP